jgi:hypothetical protein
MLYMVVFMMRLTMKNNIELYVEGCLSLLEDGLRQDDEMILEEQLDKLWYSMSDDERRLAEKELKDIEDMNHGEPI